MIKWQFRFCIYVILVFGLSFFVYAQQEDITDTSKADAEAKKILSETEKIRDFTGSAGSDYLSERWKQSFLKNKFVAGIDNFFRDINLLFVILFGSNYDFSLTLIFLILLWIFFLFIFSNILSSYTAFSAGISFFIALAINVILAQLKFFSLISIFLINIVFSREGVWRVIGFIVLIFSIIFFFVLIMLILKKMQGKRKAQRELEQKLNQKVLETTAKEILKAYEGS